MKGVKFLIGIQLALLMFFSCRKDQWDKRNLVTDEASTETLFDKIKENQNLSSFADYLVKTGYDKVLESSKTFTVWAPDNEAIKAVDPAYFEDTINLKLFVSNCIANQAFYSKEAKGNPLRIRTNSGKRVLFTGDSLNGNAIDLKDIPAKNGVLYTISTAFEPQPNAFEYFSENYSNGLQFAYLKTLFNGVVDSTLKDSLVTNNIILPRLNSYLRRINIDSEDSLLTYIVLTDRAYQNESNKLMPYFIDSTLYISDSLNQWNVIKDLTVNGVVEPDNIPAVIYSNRDSVAIHLGTSSIVKTQRVSNGIVYVVDDLDYDLATKIKPIVVQGESYFDRLDPTKALSIRKRRNPANDSIFRDVFIQNYGIASYWFRYPVTLNSVTYKVYWRAVNDFQTGTFPMMMALNHHIDTAFADPKNIPFDFTLPYKTVELKDYNDIYIGDFTPTKHGLQDLFLIGNNVTSNGQNTIVCDYIKLVPVLN